MIRSSVALLVLVSVVLSSCSSMYKEREEQRDKVAQSSGVYCDFVNGDDHNDAAVELNLQMAKKCDGSKPYTVTSYKNASDIFGLVYCCSPSAKAAVKSNSSAKPAAPAAPAAKDSKEKDDLVD